MPSVRLSARAPRSGADRGPGVVTVSVVNAGFILCRSRAPRYLPSDAVPCPSAAPGPAMPGDRRGGPGSGQRCPCKRCPAERGARRGPCPPRHADPSPRRVVRLRTRSFLPSAGHPVSVHDVGIPRIGRQRHGLPSARPATGLGLVDLPHRRSPLSACNHRARNRWHARNITEAPWLVRHPKVDSSGGIFRGRRGTRGSARVIGMPRSAGASSGRNCPGIRCSAGPGGGLRRPVATTIVLPAAAA
jgi:hypothetical protein